MVTNNAAATASAAAAEHDFIETENDQRLRTGLINMKTYLKNKRAQFRLKAKIDPPQNFARLVDKKDPRFHLTPEELEFYYPVSKDITDWTYEGDYIGSGNDADIKYLDQLLPTVYPDRSYFEDEELPFMLSLGTPLRYPPIYFIRE